MSLKKMETSDWPDEQFPRRLALSRRVAAFSYTTLSELTGVSDDTLSKWEHYEPATADRPQRGSRPRLDDAFRRVAAALGREPCWLFWGVTEEEVIAGASGDNDHAGRARDRLRMVQDLDERPGAAVEHEGSATGD